jgi:hypothetical protein
MHKQPPELVPQEAKAWEWFNAMGAPKYWVRIDPVAAALGAVAAAGHLPPAALHRLEYGRF